MYDYNKEKPRIFLAENQRTFLKIRDLCFKYIDKTGAFKLDAIVNSPTISSDTWFTMACIDRMVEIGELEEITEKKEVKGQHRVFIKV